MKGFFSGLTKCFLSLVVFVIVVILTGSGWCEDPQPSKTPVSERTDSVPVELMQKEKPVIDNATVELVQKEKRIAGVGPYSTMIVAAFEASDELKRDYKEALPQFQASLLSNLRNKKAFAEVLDGGDSTAPETVRVTGKIVSMRIASFAARFWGGGLAGSSSISVYLKVTDVKTGKVIDEKILATSNNAIAAAWTFGSSDRSLPADMGQIVSEYLCTVIPSKKN